MKKKYGTPWILAVVGALFLMTQFSAMAADKVVVIPLFGSGDEIPTVKSKTGRIWMDRNLGAIRVAGSKSDSLAYGWLYQWGRPADGHESRTSPVTDLNDLSDDVVPGHGNFIIGNASPLDWLSTQNNDLWEGGSGVNNPCPPGFRIPTKEDWETEVATWSSSDADGAFESNLKLTMPGGRSALTGIYDFEGLFGGYWTSSVDTNNYSVNFTIKEDKANISETFRGTGISVRCIKN